MVNDFKCIWKANKNTKTYVTGAQCWKSVIDTFDKSIFSTFVLLKPKLRFGDYVFTKQIILDFSIQDLFSSIFEKIEKNWNKPVIIYIMFVFFCFWIQAIVWNFNLWCNFILCNGLINDKNKIYKAFHFD